MKKQWKENNNTEKGVLICVKLDKPIFIKANFGTGDNLSDEDIKDGNNDYIYIESYAFDENEFIDDDGGQMLFNNEKEDYYHNLNHFCESVLEFLSFPGSAEYEILQIL